MHYYKVAMEASTNEGTLNKSSYTFTENGSFTFIATDIAGNVTNKTVTIDNIDKIRPENAAFEPDKDNINSEQLPKTGGWPWIRDAKCYKIGIGFSGSFCIDCEEEKGTVITKIFILIIKHGYFSHLVLRNQEINL